MRHISLILILFCFACSKKDYGPPPVQIPANAIFGEDLHKAPKQVLGTWRYGLENSNCGGGFMVNALDPQGVPCSDYIAAEHEQFIKNQKSDAPGLKDTMKFLKTERCDMDGMPCLYLELATRNLRQVQENDPFTQGAIYLMCEGNRAALVQCLMDRGSDLTDEARAEVRALAETFH
jgi:hypothetical protein